MKSRVSCRDETSPVGNLALSVTAEHGRLAVDASSIMSLSTLLEASW